MEQKLANGGLVLETERLVLRDLEESDWESRRILFSDPDVIRFLPQASRNKDEARARFERILASRTAKPRRYYRLAIVQKTDGNFVGDCVCRICDLANLEDLSRIMGDAYIGFFLEKQFWGQGLATEVATAMLEYGFKHLGLRRIWAWCDRENRASSRVLEKIGMKNEGLLMKNVSVRGEWRDSLLYGIVRPGGDESRIPSGENA